MTPEILLIVAKTNPPQLAGALEARYVVHKLDRDRMNSCDDAIAPFAARVRALVTQTAPGAPGRLIAALPALEVVACSGAHVDNIDLAATAKRGIVVSNTPGLSMGDVADFVMTQMLAVARRTVVGDRFVRAGEWPRRILGMSHRVNGQRLGIVGLGPIGRELAHRAQGFRMEVAYHGPRRKADVPYRYHPDLVEMARNVDFLAVTCRSGPETRGMIGAAVFEALGPGGIFANVTRGVVDEVALLAALRQGHIRGAALDVFETSPQVPDELIRMDNVVLSPHVAGYTKELTHEQTEMVIANLEAHFAGQPLPNKVGSGAH